MLKLLQALKSRTVWTIILIVLINSIPIIKNAFPSATWIDSANVVLAALATYFHVTPIQPTVGKIQQ